MTIVPALLVGIPSLISLAAVLGTFYGIQHTNQVNVKLQKDRIRSDEKMKHQEILRSKGEQLYAAIDMFETAFRQSTVSAATALFHQRGQEAVDALDMRTCNTNLLTIEMLANVYFPSTAKELEELKAQWRMLGSTSKKVVESTDQLSMSNTGKELVILSTRIAESAEQLQKQVIRALQRLHADVVELGD